MFKFTTFAKIAATLAVATLSLQAAPALANPSHDRYDRHVVIQNESSQTIIEVRGTPTTWDNYGHDLIPTSVIGSGEQQSVNFDVGSGECQYDLQVKLEDGNTVTRHNVNVCAISNWTVGD
ncbi:hypothetical protein [Sphingomonas sp.]|uniref:hypothetical protein n=1 Tax=Sphingomonas sp. TaxID=28214 RepID=UPI003CC56595